MKRFIIGNSLKDEALVVLKVGLKLAKQVKHRATVIHSDRLADFDSLDTIFNQLNMEVKQQYIDNIITSNNLMLKEQIQSIGDDYEEFEYFSRSGTADDILIKEARDSDVDLVVLGHNANKTWSEKFLGGVTESVLHRCENSVLIVKDEKLLNPKKILLAYDFSYHCDEALNWAKMMKSEAGIELHLVNVLPCYYEGYYLIHQMQDNFNELMEKIITEGVDKVNKRLSEVRGDFPEQDNIICKTILDKEGSVSSKLADYCDEHEIDLIVMGSHKRGKIGDFVLGSVASKVLKKVKTNILIAK